MSKQANKKRMQMIVDRAHQVRKEKPTMKWTDAIKKASDQLKKEGKL